MNSLQAKTKKGLLVCVWNETFKGYDFYRKVRGGYSQCNPFNNIVFGETISRKKLQLLVDESKRRLNKQPEDVEDVVTHKVIKELPRWKRILNKALNYFKYGK